MCFTPVDSKGQELSLKILWMSNSPLMPTGYGQQTALFTRLMVEAGHKVIVRANFGHYGAMLEYGGVKILPSGADSSGNDVIVKDYTEYQPDAHVILYDAWVYDPDVLAEVPACLYAPIDHDPMTEVVAQRLKCCAWTWAMSRFGERQMRQEGIDPFYVPHGVDTEVFHPVDRTEARRKWMVDDDAFLVAMNAANKGYPIRKSFDRVLKAWAHFIETHPKAVLHLHTDATEKYGGPDLTRMAQFYGLPETSLRFVDPHKLADGEYSPRMLNELYNAADVLLSPSMGEGFGIPVIEAEAAGCPVIVTDFSAQSELAGPGYKIPINRLDDMVYTQYGSEMALVPVSGILSGLEWAYANRGNAKLRAEARDFAMDYDAKTVFSKHMLPALVAMAQGNADSAGTKRITKPLVEAIPDGRETAVLLECRAKGHDWSPTGVWNEQGELNVPCRRAGCEAELRKTKTGWLVNPTGFKAEVNGIPLDIEDDPTGGVAKIIMREIEQNYDLDEIDFQPGDVVIDIGAHVGIVSIYLAKKHPEIRVFAFEPSLGNFERLQRNIIANGVSGRVYGHNRAVTSDGRELTLSGDPQSNTGGISAFTTPNGHSQQIASTTIAEIFRHFNLDRVKLLKIDCEGAEFEILQGAGELLRRVDHLRGEFHSNDRLKALGYDPAALDSYCEQFIADVKVHACEIAS